MDSPLPPSFSSCNILAVLTFLGAKWQMECFAVYLNPVSILYRWISSKKNGNLTRKLARKKTGNRQILSSKKAQYQVKGNVMVPNLQEATSFPSGTQTPVAWFLFLMPRTSCRFPYNSCYHGIATDLICFGSSTLLSSHLKRH